MRSLSVVLSFVVRAGCFAAATACAWSAVCGTATEPPVPFTPERLEALGMIESGNNDRARGGAGEVSRFQIHPKVWRAYSRSRDYHDPTEAVMVARRHWEWLANYFQSRTGRAPQDFDMYVLWNTRWGYYERCGFRPSRVSPAVAERARRFANLVRDQSR